MLASVMLARQELQLQGFRLGLGKEAGRAQREMKVTDTTPSKKVKITI